MYQLHHLCISDSGCPQTQKFAIKKFIVHSSWKHSPPFSSQLTTTNSKIAFWGEKTKKKALDRRKLLRENLKDQKFSNPDRSQFQPTEPTIARKPNPKLPTSTKILHKAKVPQPKTPLFFLNKLQENIKHICKSPFCLNQRKNYILFQAEMIFTDYKSTPLCMRVFLPLNTAIYVHTHIYI